MKDVEIDVKDVRRLAFAVGIGFTLGKWAGGIVISAFDGLTRGILKILAKEGNKTAQEICVKTNIKYDDENNDIENKTEIGFHC